MLKKLIYIAFFMGLSISLNSMEDPRMGYSELSDSDILLKESKIKVKFNIQDVKFDSIGDKFGVLGKTNLTHIRIFNSETQKLIKSKETAAEFSSISFFPKLKTIGAISAQRSLFWDYESGNINYLQPPSNLSKKIGTTAIAFSPSKQLLIVGASDGSATIRKCCKNYTTGNRVIYKIDSWENDPIDYAVFNNFGNFVALATERNHLRIYKKTETTNTGQDKKLIWEIKYENSFNEKIKSIEFIPLKEEALIFAETNNYLLNFNNDMRAVSIVDYCNKTKNCLIFDGTELYESSYQGDLESTYENKKLIDNILHIKSAYYNRNGNLMVTVGTDESRIWSKQNDKWICLKSCKNNVQIALCPKGFRFITYLINQKEIMLYELPYCKDKRKNLEETEDIDIKENTIHNRNCADLEEKEFNNSSSLRLSIQDVKFNSKNDKVLIIFNILNEGAQMFQIWDLKTKKLIKKIKPPSEFFFSSAVLYQEDSGIMLMTQYGVIIFYPQLSGCIKVERKINKCDNTYITSVGFSLKKNMVLLGYNDGSAMILNTNPHDPIQLNQWKIIQEIPTHGEGSIYFTAINDAGTIVVLATEQGGVKILHSTETQEAWEPLLTTPLPLNEMLKYEKIKSVKFTPDNNEMIIMTETQMFKLKVQKGEMRNINLEDYCPNRDKQLNIIGKKLIEHNFINEKTRVINEEDLPIKKAYYNEAGNTIVTILQNGNSCIWYCVWHLQNHKWVLWDTFNANTHIALSSNGSSFITYCSCENSYKILFHSLSNNNSKSQQDVSRNGRNKNTNNSRSGSKKRVREMEKDNTSSKQQKTIENTKGFVADILHDYLNSQDATTINGIQPNVLSMDDFQLEDIDNDQFWNAILNNSADSDDIQ